MKAKYDKVLFKLSGEAFLGNRDHGIDVGVCVHLAHQIKEVVSRGVQITVVVGGGNLFRGVPRSKEFEMERSVADYMGMLATVLNGLALQNALEHQGVHTRVMTAIEMHQIAEPYIRRRALRHLEKGRVVIFVAGTGNPYFTTDTAAALRSVELGADILLKGTKVDGVYDSDPMKNSNAQKFKTLTYKEVLNQELKIMDATAISLCMDNSLPILVFDFMQAGNLAKVIDGSEIGTIIK